MLIKPRYSLKDMLLWTRVELLLFLCLAAIVAALYRLADFHFLHLPWAPVAVIGTAVAFIVGFQNNAAYGRIWEARKIWGGIVNTSRTWGMMTGDMINNEHAKEAVSDEQLAAEKRTIVMRHVAWMAALRHAMRAPKPWEEFAQNKTNREWIRLLNIPERKYSLEEEMREYLSDEDLAYVLSKPNKATALLYLQSRHIARLRDRGLIWEFAFLQLEGVLQELFTLQGKSERIKNFPYPRQYATLSHVFVRLFILMIPFAAIPEFSAIGSRLQHAWPLFAPHFIWIGIPFCALISWIFSTMERIGKAGENPFEGTANDVPISTIARGIEIDMRRMLDQDAESIPAGLKEALNVQM